MWAHEFTVFPHKLFWWEAPDGSRLLTYFSTRLRDGNRSGTAGKRCFGVDALALWNETTPPPANAEMMHLYGVRRPTAAGRRERCWIRRHGG